MWCVCVCPTASVFPRPLSFACERTWKTAGERKFETEEEGGGRGQSSLKSCLSTCVFIVTFHFSSNSAQFPSQVHVCQRLLLSFVQPRCAWSNHYLSSLYIYYFIVNSSGGFLFFVSVFVFSSFNLLLPFPLLTRISHRSCPVLFVRGWVWILLCVGVTAGFQHPTDIHRSF